jgi:hypothetical protein
MRECLDSWREVLFKHLDEEVYPSLPSMAILANKKIEFDAILGRRLVGREYEKVLEA